MSENHVLGRKKYWASLSPEQRSARMADIAQKRQKKLTFKQKRDHALKMVAARNAKKTPPVI